MAAIKAQPTALGKSSRLRGFGAVVTLGRGSPGKRGFFPPGSRPAGFSLGALFHNPQSVPGPDPLHGVDELGGRQRLSQFLDRPLGIPRSRLDVVCKDALGLVDRI
jgi:hypothetical protein